MSLNKKRFLSVKSRMGRRTRIVLLNTLIVTMVLTASGAPQSSVSACSGTGYCPCPGC